MNENEFELDGKVYVKTESSAKLICNNCCGCAGEYDSDLCISLPVSCLHGGIIFVEKQP